MITTTVRDVANVSTDIKQSPTMDDKWAFDYRFYAHLLTLNDWRDEFAETVEDINDTKEDLNNLKAEINSTEGDIESDANDAAGSATSAENSKDMAYAWATKAEDEEVSGGEYSAYHYAQKAYAEAQGGTYGNAYKDKINEFDKAMRAKSSTVSFSSSITIDLQTANDFELELTGDTTIAASNMPASGYAQEGIIRIEQDSTGGHAITWDSVFKFVDDENIIDASADGVTWFAYKAMPSEIVMMRI